MPGKYHWDFDTYFSAFRTHFAVYGGWNGLSGLESIPRMFFGVVKAAVYVFAGLLVVLVPFFA